MDALIADIRATLALYAEDETSCVRFVAHVDAGDGLLFMLAVFTHGAIATRWSIRAKGVRRACINLPADGIPEIHEEHPLLQPHRPWGRVLVEKAPREPLSLVRRLMKEHAEAASWVGVETTLEAEPEADATEAAALRVLTLGRTWVVAEEFSCQQIVPVCNGCAAKLTEGESAPVDEHTHGHAHLKLLPSPNGVEVPQAPTWPPSGGTA